VCKPRGNLPERGEGKEGSSNHQIMAASEWLAGALAPMVCSSYPHLSINARYIFNAIYTFFPQTCALTLEGVGSLPVDSGRAGLVPGRGEPCLEPTVHNEVRRRVTRLTVKGQQQEEGEIARVSIGGL
jgi:hypothetical protein